MINIHILCVGKLKEKELYSLCNEYLKRIGKYAKIDVTEVSDEKIINSDETVKKLECDKLINKLKGKNTYIICLDLKGTEYTSEAFADKLSKIATYNSSDITFIIGGSLGLNDEILNMANEKISFSKMTFPHGLFRLFLTEQIYRAFQIQNKTPYHK